MISPRRVQRKTFRFVFVFPLCLCWLVQAFCRPTSTKTSQQTGPCLQACEAVPVEGLPDARDSRAIFGMDIGFHWGSLVSSYYSPYTGSIALGFTSTDSASTSRGSTRHDKKQTTHSRTGILQPALPRSDVLMA